MKKNLYILLALVLVFTSLTPVFGENKIKLEVNGQIIKPDVEPFIENGRTLVPIRFISEALGYNVSWNQEKREVSVFNQSVDMVLKIGDKDAIVNGKLINLDVPAKIVESRTFVPLRFIGESFGMFVDWNDTERKVIVKENLGENLKDFDTKNLTKEEAEYLNEILSIREDIKNSFDNAKYYLFEAGNTLDKDTITSMVYKYMNEIDGLLKGRLANINVPERFKTSHEAFVKSSKELVDAINKMLTSFGSGNKSDAISAFTMMTNFSIMMKDSFDRLKAEAAGVEYRAQEGIKDYKDILNGTDQDRVIKNLLDKIGQK